MILSVTLNPALDVTYQVDQVVLGTDHRIREVTTCAGGKGLNVARVLTCAGLPVRATGLLGGETGERILASLRAWEFVPAFEDGKPVAVETVFSIPLN